MSKHEGTLQSHGVRFRFNFLAGTAYEDDDGTVWTYGSEPMWAEADLTAEQLAELDALIAEHLAERPQDDPMTVRWGNMEHNGVQHSHRRGRSVIPQRPAYGYECAICKGYIINENPGDYRFVGGPADGRWYVTDGRPYWMVPVVHPVTLATLDNEPVAGPSSVTYERQGDRYFALIGSEQGSPAADSVPTPHDNH